MAPLQCPETVAIKGDVKSGPALVHSFELTHRGTGTLTVTRVEAGCGCLRKSLSTGVLQPGETANLTLEVNTLTQPVGLNRWQVVVAYKVENPGAPVQTGEIFLQINATLSREIIVNPPQIGFSTTGGASQILTLTDSRTKPLNIIKVTSSSPHLTGEVGPRTEVMGGGYNQKVTIKLSEDARVGHRDEAVVLLTDDPGYPEFRIPVRVLKRAAGAIMATPESVAIRFGSEAADVSTLVQLRSPDGKAFSIKSVESDYPGVTVKWSMGSGSVAVVRVTVSESAGMQSGNCTVRVKLDETTAQEVVLPVSWIATKKER